MKPSLILAVLALGGCASMEPRQIGGVVWRAVDINGVAVGEGEAPTLRLDGGRASGNASCNRFSGSYELGRAEQRLRFGPLAATRMACPPPMMEQERRYLGILEAVSGYTFYGDGSLSLVAADGRAIRYRRN